MDNNNIKSTINNLSKINLEKLYIEPTNFCNLSCKTCIRNIWKHEFKQLSLSVIKKLVDELKAIDTLKTVMLSGFGEPLCHKNIIEIIKSFKSLGVGVEMISNGILIDEKMAIGLIESGLNTLWISIDGASAESYEKIRSGASQDKLLNNLILLNNKRILLRSNLELGISFVAMKDNIHELPEISILARNLGAKYLKVTNVLPYTKDMVNKTLYNTVLYNDGDDFADTQLNIDLPSMDINSSTKEVLYELFRNTDNKICLMGADLTRKYNYCKFIKEGCAVIGADGRLSPCLALLYENKTFLNNYERTIKPVSYGNIKENSISEIWNCKDYHKFRAKVDEFDFSFCISCGGCNNFESNEEDCFGNEFPVCGGCLWAQGIIQCP